MKRIAILMCATVFFLSSVPAVANTFGSLFSHRWAMGLAAVVGIVTVSEEGRALMFAAIPLVSGVALQSYAQAKLFADPSKPTTIPEKSMNNALTAVNTAMGYQFVNFIQSKLQQLSYLMFREDYSRPTMEENQLERQNRITQADYNINEQMARNVMNAWSGRIVTIFSGAQNVAKAGDWKSAASRFANAAKQQRLYFRDVAFNHPEVIDAIHVYFSNDLAPKYPTELTTLPHAILAELNRDPEIGHRGVREYYNNLVAAWFPTKS